MAAPKLTTAIFTLLLKNRAYPSLIGGFFYGLGLVDLGLIDKPLYPAIIEKNPLNNG